MTTLLAHLRTSVRAAGAESRVCNVVAAWSTDDPFAVELTFPDEGFGDVKWNVARELLAESLITFARLGVGDVHIQRYRNACAVKIELSSPSGQCDAITCTTPLTEFLNATYRMCPPGGDVEHEAIEHALAELRSQLEASE